MDRKQFLKSAAAVGVFGILNDGIPNVSTDRSSTDEVTFNNLPLWRGFNLQEKFTHKPDEWLSIAPEWGFKNEPFRESDFAIIHELGFNFVRLPMSYKCWCDENDWYCLQEKHLKEIDQVSIWPD